MGVMTSLAPADHTPLVFTPHPVTLEGQQLLLAELREGETLGQFLDRTIDLGADAWEVKVGGVVVPVEMWDRVKPKHGHLIEVRGAVRKQALYIVAMIALTYFTMGAGATWAGALGATGFAATAVYAGAFIVGSILINKALGPKPPKQSSEDRESVYNLAGARNAVRPHEPLGLLFGSTRIAPDVISQPYTRYYGNDQYLYFVLTPGLNVDRFDALYLGDTLLSSYDGVQVWTAGFPGMPEQAIPIHTNADTVAGGELSSSGWVERTTSPDTVEILINLEYLLGGVGTSGKKYYVDEQVQVQYRPVGSSTWQTLVSQSYRSNKIEERRSTIARTVAKGQYDVRVRIAGIGNYTGDNTHYNDFTWSTMVSVQEDTTDYRGIPRIGIMMKATGQLVGTPDQIRAVFHQRDMPIWTGSGWSTATDRASGLSNPGALIIAYARGFKDPDDNLVAGMGLPDSMIDIPALQAFTLHCAAKGYTYDHWLQSPRSHAEMVESIALAGFGQTTWAGGKLSVVWAADGQPLSGVVNMATMKRGTFEVDYNLASAADGIEYTYFDRETWQSATLRVPAPGVTTMLNPARLTGEGVTTEAHAAQLARYHLAQHLYQFKSIGFSTDLEHMSYRRLSCLALQHDMTKWGRGGRVVSATNSGGLVTLTLDEPVSPPSTGNAYIGLRIPGERVYRVLQVQSFATETDTITLADPWPAGVPLPGSTAGNPAHDTIWIYDFKATPGYRVRVVSIEPESGLKGARVSVVPESPEFWNYVHTGYYEPPVVVPGTGQQRPSASNLVISENQIQVGSGEYTELTATFDLAGRAQYSVVYAGLAGQPMVEVAQTNTRTATWRIEEAGQYTIEVRPFGTDGLAGGSVQVVYITARADIPPPVFDWFHVIELPGGVRRYEWGYTASTMQAANLAGAEIRYIAGSVSSPEWDDMTPVGEGFHTAHFEAVVPPEGTYTFASRARNTSGALSSAMITIVRTLGENLGEVIDQITEQQVEQQGQIDQAVYDAALAQAAAAEALALAGTPWDDTTAWQVDDVVYHSGRIYRAIAPSTNVEPPNPAYWDDIGTVTESVGENASAISQLQTDVAGQAAAITQVQAGQVGSGNLLPNADFGRGMEGVVEIWNQAGASHSVYVSDSGLPQAGLVIQTNGPPSVPGGNIWYRLGIVRGVEAGRRYGAAARFSGSRTGSIIFRFVSASGGLLAEHYGSTATGTGGDALTDAGYGATVVGPQVAPPGTSLIELIGVARIDAIYEYGIFLRPQVEEFRTGQTQISPWAPAATGLASATFALQAAQDAQITMTTNVNGHVSGMYSKNDGHRSVIAFLADTFELITSGSVGVRFTRRNGGYFMRFYAASVQLVLGINFGSLNNLCFWYGPNVGEENCTKGNATIWFDNAGSAYFGGSLSAGVRHNARTSTLISTTASITLDPFGTNGNPKQVTGSLSYSNNGYLNGNVAATYDGTPLSATVSMERSYNGGAWAQVGTVSASGVVSAIYDAGQDRTVIGVSISGSTTLTDSAPGTLNFQYRAVITSASGYWPLGLLGGLNGGAGVQNLTISSTEA